MDKYVLRRSIIVFPTALAVVTLVFLILHIAPGDPARIGLGQVASSEDIERARAQLGLDDPLLIQYVRFLARMVTGDLGTSFITHEPVVGLILSRLPVTLQLTFMAMLLSTIVGVSAGVISAVRRNTAYDYLTLTAAVIGYCTPNFWLALLLIIVFSVNLRWLPSIGKQALDLKYVILPTLSLSAPLIAIIARLTRAGMLEVINSDYVRTARAKGLAERAVISRHALRNALIPVVTVLGLQLGSLLGGTVVVETIFSWPGIGWLLFSGISQRDYPVVQGVVLFYSVVFMFVTLAVDIGYSYLDPRVRYE
ncbi:MAG: ABC transporter permease [Caldilineaceae bacterium]|uniref:ABC transporter permease n=1 Tax=Caldilineaceae bacterium SB0675_bin_29 TaxID=2605266 RepID=A0A6B1FXS9_9CHLR|nr:ABC transporter permease [Caldilineaceae bacterium]MYH60841.1 ABC transporter permease [Caldilineaceae bacterium SB0675_bin_29]